MKPFPRGVLPLGVTILSILPILEVMVNALEMRNVSVVRDGHHLVDSLDLTVREGESLAVIGLNGSGKTTLIRLLRGDIHPFYDEEDPAEMRIFGDDKWDIFDIRCKMGIVSMDLQNMFRENTKVYEVISSGFFGTMDIFRNLDVSEEMIRKTFEKAKLLGIEDLMERDFGTLSLGEMRRALIARALITEPKMLVLDEPMTGLDIVMRSKFRSMFDLLMSTGVSIVMVTHDLSDIPVCVDRVVMMRGGRIIADGTKEELLTDPMISKVYGEPIKVECTGGIYRMHLAE